MDTTRRLAVKVGALVIAGVVIAFVVVVALGKSRMFFRDKRTLHAYFPDVAGLQEGAPVRLGGRIVGLVTSIRFTDDLDPARALRVTVKVPDDFADRIRTDSKAYITSQGLLGDKLVEITIGSRAAERIADGGEIPAEPPADPARLLGVATEAAEHAKIILERIDVATRDLEGEGALADVGGLLSSARRTVERIEQGPGTLHDLVYDDTLARRAEGALAEAKGAAAAARRVIQAVPMRDVRALVANAARAADRIAAVADAIEPEDVGATTRHVARASEDLAFVAKTVREGRGTLGGLIMDPTLYEETKRILVNVRRNRVLKGLARLVISKDTPDAVMDASPRDVVVRPRPAPETQPKRARGTDTSMRR